MKKLFLAFCTLALSISSWAQQPFDVLIKQYPVNGGAPFEVAVSPTANYVIGFDANKRPVALPAGSGSGDALVANPLTQFTGILPTNTEFNYVQGVTSAIQTQLNAKQATITFGTGVLTALGVNVGSAGAPVLFNGALGTPTSGVATNLTGTASSLTAGTVTTNANLTGHITSVGNAAVLGSFTSAQLRTAVTDETGTGLAVFASDPTFTLTDLTTNDSTTSQHGWLPKLGGGTTNFLRADGTWAAPPGSGTISSGTTNTLSKYTAATTLGNSLLSDNATTLSYTGTGGITAAIFTGSGTTPAALALPAGTGSIPTLPANSAGWAAPATGGTAWLGKLPATITAGVLTFGAPGTVDGVNESAVTSTAITGTGNVVFSASPTLTGTIGGASLTLSSLTSGRATYAGASGLLSDEAAYAYNAATNILTVGGISLGAGSEVSTIGQLVDSVDGTTPLHTIIQTVASGTAYTLTATSAAVDFGTTDPIVTLANAGTYWVSADIQYNYVGSTFAANRQFDEKIRRTNNTAADVTGSAFSEFVPTLTTITDAGPHAHIGPFLYTTAGTTDTLQVFADISVLPTAGTVTVTACVITAQRAF